MSMDKPRVTFVCSCEKEHFRDEKCIFCGETYKIRNRVQDEGPQRDTTIWADEEQF